jgi:hypothetical protein
MFLYGHTFTLSFDTLSFNSVVINLFFGWPYSNMGTHKFNIKKRLVTITQILVCLVVNNYEQII